MWIIVFSEWKRTITPRRDFFHSGIVRSLPLSHQPMNEADDRWMREHYVQYQFYSMFRKWTALSWNRLSWLSSLWWSKRMVTHTSSINIMGIREDSNFIQPQSVYRLRRYHQPKYVAGHYGNVTFFHSIIEALRVRNMIKLITAPNGNGKVTHRLENCIILSFMT